MKMDSFFLCPLNVASSPQASLLGGQVQDAQVFGWRVALTRIPADDEGAGGRRFAHDWGGMVQGVQNYIKGLNFKYRTDLLSKGVSLLRD